MKTTYLKIATYVLFCLLFIQDAYCSIGNDRTIIVELFGTNVFYVDEQGNGVFEREQDLINYCISRNYETMILNIAPFPSNPSFSILEPIFSRTIINVNTPTSPANIGILETHLGQFLNAVW